MPKASGIDSLVEPELLSSGPPHATGSSTPDGVIGIWHRLRVAEPGRLGRREGILGRIERPRARHEPRTNRDALGGFPAQSFPNETRRAEKLGEETSHESRFGSRRPPALPKRGRGARHGAGDAGRLLLLVMYGRLQPG